jgi:GNAT superfamily N-acetyltransferase
MTTLRAARSTDAGKVGAILSEFVQTTAWMPRLHSGAEDIAHAGQLIAAGLVTVAEQKGKIVGFIATDGQDLDALYVAETARRAGVGETLLTHVRSQQDRIELWTFQANTPAQQFYLKHGFVEVTRTDGVGNDEGLPDIRYSWQRKAQ